MFSRLFGKLFLVFGAAFLVLNTYSFFYVIPRNVNANKVPSAKLIIV